MILQAVDFIQVIADIVAAILNFLNPIVSPMGLWMVNWMEYVLQFFPRDNLTIYITIAIVIVVIGLFVNIAWPGNKKPGFLVKAEEKDEKIEKKVNLLDQKAKKKTKEIEEKKEELQENFKQFEEDADELEENAEVLKKKADKLEEEIEEAEKKSEED
ncbi:MAG: hypothetical protein ACFE8G_04825 [Candidatus Hermodarchaeota archaeon]